MATSIGSPVASLSYDDLYARLATVTAERDAARAELGKCQAFRAWVYNLLENTELDAGDKVTAIATHRMYRESMQDTGRNPEAEVEVESEPENLGVWRIARAAGSSPQSAGDRLKRLAKAGAVKRVEQKTRSASGTPITRVYVAPTVELLSHPKRIAFPTDAKPQRGGVRRICYACGSANLRHRIYCGNCGEGLVDEPLPQPADGPDITEKKIGPLPGSQLDTSAHPVYVAPAKPERKAETINTVAPKDEPEPIAQESETRNSFPDSQLDLQGDPEPDPEPDPAPVQVMACGHPTGSLRKVGRRWVCGLCPAPERRPRGGAVCNDCASVMPQALAHAVWAEDAEGKRVPLIVCAGCRDKRMGGKAG